MNVGIGLPNSVHTLDDGRILIEFARRAEERGFSVLGTIGRIAYPSHEELIVLAAAAAVTERIGLFTDILLGPTREPLLLAKQAATIDRLSGGRFVLGAGVGARKDDFDVVGVGFDDRGKRWDDALELMHRAWRGEPPPGTDKPVTPRPINGASVPMMFGGQVDAAVRRIVRWGIGYTLGGGPPEALARMKARVDAAWKEAGRDGRPRYRALSYAAFGARAHETAEEALRHYYAGFGERIWQATPKDRDSARQRMAAFEAVGCDDFLFFLEHPDPGQVDDLADAVLD
jgi:alkanesulfonate monooxygenase SsuD/methylene tetrahydromethanopterin reductase-like flavin-dependent oxidoreductase (luciferase family)